MSQHLARIVTGKALKGIIGGTQPFLQTIPSFVASTDMVHPLSMRQFSTSKSKIVDIRSDTVTKPSRQMLECSLNAPLGDDVFGDDPTVLALEAYAADLFGKESALFVPTGTMSNLVAILSHCNKRASEIIIGAESHICLWEGGGAANLGGVHSREVIENSDGTMDLDLIKDRFRLDDDDHCAKTELICLENTHNMMGGTAIPTSYIDSVSSLATDLGIKVHLDGARIFNAAVALGVSVKDLCRGADSVSICLSKGLGAPLGSILVGESEFIRLAKRARKRVGGGMRQVGVVAAMGNYALHHNVERLEEDHHRAKRIAKELYNNGFKLAHEGNVDTNIVYFGLPENSSIQKEDLRPRLLEEYGVKITGGYSKGGELFRLVTHLGVDDEDIERAIEGIINLALKN